MREGRYFLHAHSHSSKSWDQPTVVDFMNRFPDTLQTVTDRGLFGMNTLTRWLTNSGCIAQALSTSNYQESKGKVTGKPAAPGTPGIPGISEDSETHRPTVCQTMKAVSQQLQSLRRGTSRGRRTSRGSGKRRTMSRADRWIHVKSKLLVKMRCSTCGTGRCTSTPPKRNRGHERDATR